MDWSRYPDAGCFDEIVSSGSMSGSWVGSPSLMMENRWRPEATG